MCIVNWNCREYLRGCLESLSEDRQKVALEVIVVDNASTDGAADMVAAQFPNVLLIRNEANRGFSRGNNQAARSARGRYLFFLNNDTVVPPGALHELLEFAEAHPEAGMIGPLLRDPDGSAQVSYRRRPSLASLLHRTTLLRWTNLLRGSYRNYRRQQFDAENSRSVDILMGAAIFTPREKFLSWGGWDEDFPFGGEDIELSIRAGQQTKLVFWPGVEILHYGRTSTRQSLPASTNISVGMARYLRKTGERPLGLLLYKIVFTLDAPVTMAVKTAETSLRLLRGKKRKALKSWRSVQVSWHFVTRGLVGFWRA